MSEISIPAYQVVIQDWLELRKQVERRIFINDHKESFVTTIDQIEERALMYFQKYKDKIGHFHSSLEMFQTEFDVTRRTFLRNKETQEIQISLNYSNFTEEYAIKPEWVCNYKGKVFVDIVDPLGRKKRIDDSKSVGMSLTWLETIDTIKNNKDLRWAEGPDWLAVGLAKAWYCEYLQRTIDQVDKVKVLITSEVSQEPEDFALKASVGEKIDTNESIPDKAKSSLNESIPDKAKSSLNESITFESLFKRTSQYQDIKEILVNNNLCQPVTYHWKDRSKGYKGTIIGIIETLYLKGYLERRPTHIDIQAIAINFFGCETCSISYIKQFKRNDLEFEYIPYALDNSTTP